MDRVFLLPGEAKFSRKPMTISTLLGSCVAVCLHDRQNRWGGMNHYMLPLQNGREGLEPGKYGDHAINALIQVALRLGARQGNLVASLFGGGNVVGHLGSLETTGRTGIGDANIAIARELLEAQHIRVVREDVGGTRGRKIHMDTAANEIQVRQIVPSEDAAERAERRAQFKQRKVQVLLVDDSATVRHVLRAAIEASDDLEVCGEAANPYEAREQILETMPDVMCLDIIMPRMDGHNFLRRIMHFKPIPTVVVSTIAKRGSEMRAKVLQAGAVDVVDKEELEIYKGRALIDRVLLAKLRRAAATPVKKR